MSVRHLHSTEYNIATALPSWGRKKQMYFRSPSFVNAYYSSE